jgi:hypothetical protein
MVAPAVTHDAPSVDEEAPEMLSNTGEIESAIITTQLALSNNFPWAIKEPADRISEVLLL